LQYITMCFAAQNNAVLCNGANMAYRKRFFNRTNGFKSNENFSSGDDIFLLFQLKKENKNAIAFTVNTDSIVSTEAIRGITGLINQKIRWASKSIHITDASFILLSLLAVGSNIWLLCLFPLEFNIGSWPMLSLSFLSVKCIFDFIMIKRISTRYNSRFTIGSYLLSFVLYPFYLIGVFILSIFKNPTWKGRAVRI
jgi:biofilm PGA synthesis N-glycosyltransferase PgaC